MNIGNAYCNPDFLGYCSCCGIDGYRSEHGPSITCGECGQIGICVDCVVFCAECEPKGKESIGCKKCLILDSDTGDWFHDENEANARLAVAAMNGEWDDLRRLLDVADAELESTEAAA